MIIDSFSAQKVLIAYEESKDSVIIDFDLGFTHKEIFFQDDNVKIEGFTFPLELFRQISRKQAIFELSTPPKIIAFYDKHYYKLEPIKNSAPTLEIDGIRMHRTKLLSPLEDAENKILLAGIQTNDGVLDICTGLGYTAISAIKAGAKVVTIEKDPNVLEIAKYNPFSKILFNPPNENQIKIIVDDASKVVKTFDDESFDVILHDPPRFSFAGELYSESFYRELYRILKIGGRILHYVGNPGSKYRGKDYVKGVQERLVLIGFQTSKTPDGESVLGYK